MLTNKGKIWEDKDNNKLAQIVIDSIKRGSNIQHAYAEASKQLNRTEEACRTRWLKKLCKKYKTEVKFAEKVANSAIEGIVQISAGIPNTKTDLLASSTLDFDLLKKLLAEQEEGTSAVDKSAVEIAQAARYLTTRILEIVVVSNAGKNDFLVLDKGDNPHIKAFHTNYDHLLETTAYFVKTDGKRVLSCDCKDSKKALAYMMKVAFERNLEIF